jgi:tRNA(Ile)-lysidine synthase
LDLPIEVGRADVRALASDHRRSLEDAARTARYTFLERAADALGAELIAVAHTRDDQAETFLLRLVRGAGPRGLAGIRPRAGRVIRPLLDVGRSELRELIAERQLSFREDATNADVRIPRNRVRHELIPYLQREFSPGIVDVLAREAAIARADEERLHAEAIDLARTVVLGTDGRVELDAAAVSALPMALGARIAREALAQAAPGRYVAAEHIEQLLDLAHGRIRGAVSLPGCTARPVGDRIVMGSAPARPFANSFRFPLSIPGEVTLTPQGWAVSAAWREGGAAGEADGGDCWTAPILASAVALPLAVRSRQPGDRIRPPGLHGRGKKLQDLLVDRKVPRESRDALPLVVDGDDRIVWVVGQVLSEDFRVTTPSQGVILLKARRLGGLG